MTVPRDLIRCDLDLVYPPLVRLGLTVLSRCLDRGARYYWASGFRSWGDQHQLRLRYLNGGARAAPAGLSAHNYGLAADFTFDWDPVRPGLQPRWGDGDYDILGEEAERVGLVWGKSFGDRPHLNWPKFVSGKELSALRGVWKTSVEILPLMTLKTDIWPIVQKASPLGDTAL